MSKGIDNTLLKVGRIGIVLIGWLVIIFTSGSMEELFRSGFIYTLGLLYDYLCVFDASIDGEGRVIKGQRIISYVGIGYSSIIIIVMILGLFGVFTLVPGESATMIIKGAYLFENLQIEGSFICILLGFYPIIAVSELLEAFARKGVSLPQTSAPQSRTF